MTCSKPVYSRRTTLWGVVSHLKAFYPGHRVSHGVGGRAADNRQKPRIDSNAEPQISDSYQNSLRTIDHWRYFLKYVAHSAAGSPGRSDKLNIWNSRMIRSLAHLARDTSRSAVRLATLLTVCLCGPISAAAATMEPIRFDGTALPLPKPDFASLLQGELVDMTVPLSRPDLSDILPKSTATLA